MTVIKVRKSVLSGIVVLFFLALPLVLSTCETPMGMGKPIDWEPPVLTMDPTHNPMYVGLNTKLSGTVTDNIAVDRVILRDSSTGKELFRAVITGDRWEITMSFSEERNGDKISAEIVAYDKAGNSGDVSIAFITLIVDVRPPIVEDIWIARTPMRTASLENYNNLKVLEDDDSKGEKSANVDRYQNGAFHINAKVSETETRIEVINLNIYDTRDLNTPLLELDIDAGSSAFSPRWLINEEAILNAGDLKWPGYRNSYYNNDNTRYYYNAVIVARDKSDNESGDSTNLIQEDEGYFCMWRKADEPKGILDPAMSLIISRSVPLPIEFFDDDSLKNAYAGLFTLDQWNGIKEIDSGVKIAGANDAEKLAWVMARIEAGGTVHNWKYDKREDTSEKEEKIVDLVKGNSLSELLYYVPTGNGENDFGEYVLFTMTRDHKLPPHADPATSARSTFNDTRIGRFYHISVIDENAPLIVFDTTERVRPGDSNDFPTWSGNSPEENTFPQLMDGRHFEISGYTLRENASDSNSVLKLRMAWVPFGIKDGNPDSVIEKVQKAMSADNYPASFEDNFEYDKNGEIISVIQHWEDVQHWEFIEGGYTPENGDKKGNLATATPVPDDTIGGVPYKRQVFRKQFDILGQENDDLKPGYTHFNFNNARENETKLFIFYIEDNLGHKVFRQFRLLGMKKAPELAVYNIFDFIDTDTLPVTLPDITIFSNNNDIRDGLYLDRLSEANKNADLFNILSDAVFTGSELKQNVLDRKTSAYEQFTRNTTLIYWIMAQKSGQIAINSITMQDVTYEIEADNKIFLGSSFDNERTQAMSYIEFFPDVTQRVFLFTAIDELGNTAELQRTIAITNAARLESITTTSQSGDYGTTDEITIKANFSGLVRVQQGTGNTRPQLNIRYPTTADGGSSVARYEIRSIPCELPSPAGSSVLSLEFKFTAPVGSSGRLQTMFNSADVIDEPGNNELNGFYMNNNLELVGNSYLNLAEVNRPIRMNGANIIDALRDETAFIPGYIIGNSRMPHWLSPTNSLQQNKNINLKGILPRIETLSIGGKDPNPNTSDDFYFKEGETIEFTLASANNTTIRPLGTPRLRYQILENNGTTVRPGNTTYYSTAFVYQRPSGSNGMVFSLPVNAANLPYDGRLVNVSLNPDSANTIIDDVRNPVVADTVSNLMGMSPSTYVYIKKIVPTAPVTTLTPTRTPIDNVYNFNVTPQMTIDSLSGAWLATTYERTEYSLDGGLTWTAYTGGTISIPDGLRDIKTRYIDKAGNNGNEFSRTVNVNTNFPQLLAVNSVQPSGWHRIGSSLEFVLDFEDQVNVDNANNVTITLRNKSASTSSNQYGNSPTYERILTAQGGQGFGTSVRFFFNNIGIDSNTYKEMPDGIYISSINLNGLVDRFGTYGGTGNATFDVADQLITMTKSSGNAGTYTCSNLSGSLRVDGITPRGTMNPASQGILGGSNDTITITFNEAVMRGSGTITIRPRENYAIPPVFEDQGYYIDQAGNRSNTPGTGKTYVDSFYDVYNALPAGGTPNHRQSLTQGRNTANGRPGGTAITPIDSMTDLALNARTGQSAGPYKKMTHGLIAGKGYTGNYTGTNVNTGPNPDGEFMIPDTATKWVLDYQYTINENVAAVNNIRAALTAAKFRWQEIDVVSTSVSDNIVTITLNQPLLKGLQWDIYYPEGAFTDLAGNPAAAVTQGNYWFWSNGVQAPVIRVNRRSFDARNSNWDAVTQRTGSYNEPPNTDAAQWNVNTATVNDTNGWGINNFNYVHYRVESESPGATIQAGVQRGRSNNQGGASGPWTGTAWAAANANISVANPGATIRTDAAWNTTDATRGTWVLSNVIRRAQENNGGLSYTITTKNGTPEVREFRDAVRVIRSHNRDWSESELSGITLNANLSNGQGFIQFDALESSKSHVVATAAVNGSTAYGYEGVFRTVIALLYGADRNNNINLVEGSNVKNGMPSIAGFPVRDAEETGDNRFVKAFFRVSATQFYWVSTEIVCEWYFLKWGGGAGGANGTHQRIGEVNNYLMVGYGDLTYSYNLFSSAENN